MSELSELYEQGIRCRKAAYALTRAAGHGVATAVLSKVMQPDPVLYDEALLRILQENEIDLIALANEVEERLKTVDKPITVAVMGCVVNGPGEASAADCGIAGGVGEGLLFKKGQIVKKVPQEQLVDELFALIDTL